MRVIRVDGGLAQRVGGGGDVIVNQLVTKERGRAGGVSDDGQIAQRVVTEVTRIAVGVGDNGGHQASGWGVFQLVALEPTADKGLILNDVEEWVLDDALLIADRICPGSREGQRIGNVEKAVDGKRRIGILDVGGPVARVRNDRVGGARRLARVVVLNQPARDIIEIVGDAALGVVDPA